MSIDRFPNVATPFTAFTVFVPLNAPLPGFVPMATVTVAVLPVTMLLFASSTWTVTAGVIAAPAAVLEGWTPKTSLVAGPGCVVTFPLVPVLELLSVAVTVWTVPAAMLVVNCTVAIPLALVMLVGALNEPPLVLLQVTVLPEFATGFPKLSASCAVIVTALPAAGVLLLDLTTYFVAGPAVTVKFAEFVPETNCPPQFVF